MDSLLQEAPCGYLAFADDGTIERINRTLLDWLAYEENSVEGQHIDQLLSGAGRIFYQTHFFPLLKLHNQVDELYLVLRTQEGGTLPVLVNGVRREREGRFINECVMLPMRQRARYEEAILQAKKEADAANRLKDEFLAMVSHELRTPLTAILGWIHILRNNPTNPQKVARAVEVIQQNAQGQAQLIEDLLDMSRITLGKMRLDMGPLNPVEVIEGAIEAIQPTAEVKQIQIRKVIDVGDSIILGDEGRLQQIMWNLLSNAVKFTPPDGKVGVYLREDGQQLEIKVTDNGIGIEPEFLPYVFERFRQGNQGITRPHRGLGLGLSIVRHLVEMHGGEIEVSSAGSNQGSCFTVRLPLRASPAA